MKARRLDEALAAGLLAAMALIAFVNVLGRYVFGYSLAFTEEITIHLFVWMVVVGMGLAFERGAQLGMASVRRLLPLGARRAITLVGMALSVGLLLAVNAMLLRTIHLEITLFHARSAALGIPVWVYHAGVPALSVFALRGVWRGAMREWREEGTCPP